MEEKIIEGQYYSFKKIALYFSLIVVILVVCQFGYYVDSSTSWYREVKEMKVPYSFIIFKELRWFMPYVCVPTLMGIVVLNICAYIFSKNMLVVTDKRVYGKTSFGKQVDLPLDSISAVGTSLFKGIAVGTSSGRIKFLGISNRNEIYEVIKKILAERQTKEVKASAPVTNITQAQSSADEIKKFKELLDSGIITQEEFDAKKKQLLGL